MDLLTQTDRDNIRNMLSDPQTENDITFILWATVAYAAARLSTEIILPHKHRGYTYQQYLVTLTHQAIILPLCALGWISGRIDDAANYIYLLTGAYVFSDSIINYSPVAGCVAGVDGAPGFSWGIHSHHLFTVMLCLLGTTLPPWLESKGAIYILLGEAGSLWITVTLLRPSATNFFLRHYSFLITRFVGTLIAMDIVRQLESICHASLLLVSVIGLAYDHMRTIRLMGSATQKVSGAGFANQRGLSR